jgi:hypothetical protein
LAPVDDGALDADTWGKVAGADDAGVEFEGV